MKASLTLLLVLGTTAAGQVRPAVIGDVPGGNLPIQQIGANDLVAISVYEAPEFSRTVRVDTEGFIRLPMLRHRMQAAGLMPADLETAVAEALQEAGLIVDPFVTVNVAEYSSRPISVMGSVRKPLTFQAAGPVTLLDALARAEGLLPDAGTEVLLTRQAGRGNAPVVQRISVKALIDAADPELNLKLSGGEEIRVPAAGRIFVVGNVKKPGAFTLLDNGESTILKALAMAEGLLPYAAKQAYIYRREAGPGNANEIPIELRKIMDRKAPDLALLANDVLYIPDAKGARAGFAALEKALLFGSGATSALIYAGVR
jgi:polysaccharide export outer membrane protein